MTVKGRSTKWRIIFAAVAATIVIGVGLFFYNAFCGNFITGMYYKSKVDAYIAETYPDRHYQVSDYRYDFKTGNYSFRIIDPDSEDGCFRAYYSENEGAVVDTYEDDVVHFMNTHARLEKALRQEVDPLIDKHLDKNKITVDAVTLGEEFGFATCWVEGFAQKEIEASLSLDMEADAKNIPIPTQIVLSLHTDEAESFRRARELADEIRALGYSIDFYDFYTSGNYFQMVPTEELMKAKSVDDLGEFIMDAYDIPKED